MVLKEEIKETGNFDIVVCGGGVAGIASAVSASRKGKKVLLDIKGLLDRNEYEKAGYDYWRL